MFGEGLLSECLHVRKTMAGAFATTTTTTTDTTNTTVAGEGGRDKKFAVMLADVGKVALSLS